MKKIQTSKPVVALVVLLVLLAGLVAWVVLADTANNEVTGANDTPLGMQQMTDAITEQSNGANNSDNSTPQQSDPYAGWREGAFTLTKLSYKVPSDWEDISDPKAFADEYRYEEVRLVADDGFVLTMSVNDLPRGYEGEAESTVLDFKTINGGNQWIITDNANDLVSRIYVGSGISAKGQKVVQIANVRKGDGLNIELSGGYDSEMTIEQFAAKKSVQQAKLVFESLRFE